jgi:PAS domain S-box-containing protein
LADVLLRTLGLELVYVCVRGSPDAAALEAARAAGQPDVAGQAQAIGAALVPWLQAAGSGPSLSILHPAGSGTVRLAVIPVGCEGEYGVVAAGSRQADFPTEPDRLLLTVGANQVAAWLREARLVAALREADRLKDDSLAREQAARAEAQRSAAEVAEWRSRYEAAIQATGQLLYDRNAQMQLASIVESSGDAIFSQTFDGIILNWNAGAERMYGYSAPEIIGQPASLLALSERQEEMPPILERIRRGERIEDYETVRRKKDGTRVEVSLTISPLKNASGQIIGASAIARDITVQKQLARELAQRAAELERINEELQQFAYIVSHDLNEPLRTVASFVSLLAKRYQGKLDAKAGEYIAYAVDGARRMERMISDLLSYTRVGGPASERTAVDCEAVLAQVMSDLQVAITEQQATVTHDPLPTVSGEATRLKQVFQNLISNALKFRGEAPPRVHVSAQRLDGHWQFAVRDNGIGIDLRRAGRLFQVFQRLHARGEYPGTGIGLAICKKIVERHGGRIWVESRPGEGATFYFTIS